MDGQEIIDLFDTLTDGLSELSAANKLALANRKYKKLANERDWEDLRTTASATITNGEIALAADFKKFVPAEEGYSAPFKNVFYIGTTPHPILRIAERRKFPNYTYYDPAQGKLITPASLVGAVNYDYFKSVEDLTTATEPLFRNSDNHSIIAYMMAIEHYAIDQTENGRDKVKEYQLVVDDMLEDMEYDDNQLKEASVDHA